MKQVVLLRAMAFAFSYLLHMMIADLSVKTGSKGQIIDIVLHYLPKDKSRKLIETAMFIILAVVLYTNLAVYITGAAEIFLGTLNIPLWCGKLIFYLLAAFVATFGIKVLGICEKYAMYGIYAVIG